MMKVETVAGLTLTLIFGVITGALGVILYLSGVGGLYGVMLALVFTGVILFLQWYFGPTVVKFMSGAKPITREQAPQIFEMVERLSKKAGLPNAPRLFIVNSPASNAFAFGRTRNDSNLALHAGIIRDLSPSELESVIAHELGHIYHRDFIVMTIASIIPVLLYYMAIVVISSFFGGRSQDDRPNFVAVLIGGLLARFLGQLLVLWLSRTREYHADAFSAKLTSGKDLAKSLVKITYGLDVKRGNESLSCLYIGDNTGENAQQLASYLSMDAKGIEEGIRNEKRKGFLEIFMTHPLTGKRLLALKQQAK